MRGVIEHNWWIEEGVVEGEGVVWDVVGCEMIIFQHICSGTLELLNLLL